MEGGGDTVIIILIELLSCVMVVNMRMQTDRMGFKNYSLINLIKEMISRLFENIQLIALL